jgi:hypothetical protein
MKGITPKRKILPARDKFKLPPSLIPKKRAKATSQDKRLGEPSKRKPKRKKIILNLIQCRRRRIMIVTSKDNESWAKHNRRCEGAEVQVFYVGTIKGIKRLIQRLKGEKYDCIVFAPSHGNKENAFIKIKNNSALEALYPILKMCLHITNHVHVCTCYQGCHLNKSIEKLATEKNFQGRDNLTLTGYRIMLNATTPTTQPENFLMTWIEHGCYPSANSHPAYVWQSVNNQKSGV